MSATFAGFVDAGYLIAEGAKSISKIGFLRCSKGGVRLGGRRDDTS